MKMPSRKRKRVKELQYCEVLKQNLISQAKKRMCFEGMNGEVRDSAKRQETVSKKCKIFNDDNKYKVKTQCISPRERKKTQKKQIMSKWVPAYDSRGSMWSVFTMDIEKNSRQINDGRACSIGKILLQSHIPITANLESTCANVSSGGGDSASRINLDDSNRKTLNCFSGDLHDVSIIYKGSSSVTFSSFNGADERKRSGKKTIDKAIRNKTTDDRNNSAADQSNENESVVDDKIAINNPHDCVEGKIDVNKDQDDMPTKSRRRRSKRKVFSQCCGRGEETENNHIAETEGAKSVEVKQFNNEAGNEKSFLKNINQKTVIDSDEDDNGKSLEENRDKCFNRGGDNKRKTLLMQFLDAEIKGEKAKDNGDMEEKEEGMKDEGEEENETKETTKLVENEEFGEMTFVKRKRRNCVIVSEEEKEEREKTLTLTNSCSKENEGGYEQDDLSEESENVTINRRKKRCVPLVDSEAEEEEETEDENEEEEGIHEECDGDSDDGDDEIEDEELEYLPVRRQSKRMAMHFLDIEAEEGEETEEEDDLEEEEEDSQTDEENESDEDNTLGVKQFIDDEAIDETFVRRKKKKVLMIESEEEEEEKGKQVEIEDAQITEQSIDSKAVEDINVRKKIKRIKAFDSEEENENKEKAVKEKRLNKTLHALNKLAGMVILGNLSCKVFKNPTNENVKSVKDTNESHNSGVVVNRMKKLTNCIREYDYVRDWHNYNEMKPNENSERPHNDQSLEPRTLNNPRLGRPQKNINLWGSGYVSEPDVREMTTR